MTISSPTHVMQFLCSQRKRELLNLFEKWLVKWYLINSADNEEATVVDYVSQEVINYLVTYLRRAATVSASRSGRSLYPESSSWVNGSPGNN